MEDPKFEEIRLRSLEDIKTVGRIAGELKAIAHTFIQGKLSSTMRVLIDSVYLHLSENTIEREIWEETKKTVINSVQKSESTRN